MTINVTQVVVSADYDCARGAVADQANTGLVRDCEALLECEEQAGGQREAELVGRRAHRGLGRDHPPRNTGARGVGGPSSQGTEWNSTGGAGPALDADLPEPSFSNDLTGAASRR